MIVYGVSMVVLQYPVIRILGRRDHMLLMTLSCLALGAGVGSAPFLPWPATLLSIVLISLGHRAAHPDRVDGGLAPRAGGAARPLHGRVDARVHGRVRPRAAARRLGAGRAGRPPRLRGASPPPACWARRCSRCCAPACEGEWTRRRALEAAEARGELRGERPEQAV